MGHRVKSSQSYNSTIQLPHTSPARPPRVQPRTSDARTADRAARRGADTASAETHGHWRQWLHNIRESGDCVCVSPSGDNKGAGGGWCPRMVPACKTMRQSLDRASLIRSPASAPPTATPTSHHHNHCDQILKSKFHTVSKKN